MRHLLLCSAPRSLLLPLLLATGLAGCSDLRTFDEPAGIVIYDAGPGGGPDGGIRKNRPVITGEIAPVYGFVTPQDLVEFYYLGEVDREGDEVKTNSIYFFYDETGEPLFRVSADGTRLVGWHPVASTIPTRAGYSPFWRVHHVRVKGSVDVTALEALREAPRPAEVCQMDAVCPSGKRCIEERCREPISVGIFALDGIKSEETLLRSKLLSWDTGRVINCPMVDADAKLLKGLAQPDLPFPKVQVWYQRLKAYCLLMEGARDLLGDGAQGELSPGGPPPVARAFFLRRELGFGTDEVLSVFPKRNLVITESLPGTPGYSPLVREIAVSVDKDYKFKDLRSVAEIESKGYPVVKTERLHNLVVRGTIPACVTDEDCAGTGGRVDPPLKCSVEQGYCSPPFARLYEECRTGVKECDPKGGFGGSRLVCLGLRVRDKYFCTNTCDSMTKDENPDEDIDSRCGAVKGYRCYPLRQSDPTRPNGYCMHLCNSRAGDKAALLAQCVSPTCGDGRLDVGETCDDGNQASGDGCNATCTLSTFDRCEQNSDCKGGGQTCTAPVFGQEATYCLPPEKTEKDESEDEGKYRTICTEYDFCWPPDDRADWLGKQEEEVKP